MAALMAQRMAFTAPRKAVSCRAVAAPRAQLMTDVMQVEKPKPHRRVPKAGFEIGFTRNNEVFVGRLAMVGFAASVVGEALSGGAGPLAQLGYDFGLPQYQVGLSLAGLVGFNAIAACLPNSATFKPEAASDETGPIRDPTITIFDIKRFFGVTNWGFTAQNELFAGRMAQLGFVAAILGELATGLGPLGQLSLETGIPVDNIQFGLLMWAGFMACTAVDKLAVKRSGSGKTTRSKTTSTRKQQASNPMAQTLGKVFGR